MNLPEKFDIKSLLKDLSPHLKRIILYEIKLPEIRLPDINLQKPKINLPKFRIPKIELPRFKPPTIKIPQIELPQINLPSFQIPEIQLPTIKIPRINFKLNLKRPEINLPKFRISGSLIKPQLEGKIYTIGQAAKLVSVSISTIRRWDKAGKIKIGRKSNGYRAFTQSEIELLKQSQVPSQIPSKEVTQNPGKAVKPYSTLSKLTLKLINSPVFLKIATVFILVSVVIFYSVLTPSQKGNNVLGVETLFVPAIQEQGPIANALGRVGNIFSAIGRSASGGKGFVVPLLGKNELETSGDLTVSGSGRFANNLEIEKNLKVKGEIIVKKIKADIVDPYLIENEGSVQSTLQIRSVGDVVLEPGNIEKLRIKEGGDVTFNGNVSGINSLTTSSITTSKFNITGDFSITGTLNGNTLSSTKLTFSGSSPSISPSTTNTGISLNGNGTGAINIGNSSTGDVYIAGGSGDSGCTITNSNGTLNCSGNITSQADIDVRGGDLTTNVTTFNLINTTATTLNIGGASTTISIGASTGTTTVNNVLSLSSTLSVTGDVTLTGDLAVNGGDLTTTAATFNVANAATTLNLGSTAVTRTINIGTGTNVDTINIGTGATGVDVISIGSSVASLALTDADWSITTAGLITTASDLAVNGGDITTTATTLNIDVGNTGSILFRDGTNTLLTIADGGTVGNVTVSGTLTSTGAFTASAGLTLSTGALSLTATSGSIALTGFGTTAITSTTASGDILAATDTSLTGSGANLANFTFKNANTGAGVSLSGVTITEQAAGTPSSGTNTSNLLNLAAAAGGTVNGINISSATGFTNFFKTPSVVIDSAGALSGVTTLTATTLAGTLSTAAQANVTSVGTLTSLAVTGNVNSSTGSLQTNGVTRVDNSGNLTAGTGSFGGAVNPSLDATYDLGTALLRWNNAYFAGDVTAGDLVFKNNFRFTENGDKGINILNPKGEVIGGFDNEGNLWMKGEVKQYGTGN